MSDFNDLIKEEKPTLADFYATWCGPCKMQSPIIEKVKEAVGDDANVLKIDIDKNREVARSYNVQSIPTLILFKSGEPLWRAVGLHQADVLEAKIREYVKAGDDRHLGK